MRSYLAAVAIVTLASCSSHNVLLNVDVKGDQTYSGVSLRMSAAGSTGKTFTNVTFGTDLAFKAGIYLSGDPSGPVEISGDAFRGTCLVGHGSVMVADVKTAGVVTLTIDKTADCPAAPDAGADDGAADAPGDANGSGGMGDAGTHGSGGAGSGGAGTGTGGNTGAAGSGGGGTGTGGTGTGGTGTRGLAGTGGAGPSCAGAGICGRSSTGIVCAQSNGVSAFTSGSAWSDRFSDGDGWKGMTSYWSTIQFPDVTGDGRADICGRNAGGIFCATSDGASGFVQPRYWQTDYSDTAGWNASPAYWATIQYPDIDGDGKADICGRSSGGIWCAISNGADGFGPPAIWSDAYSDANSWSASQSTWGTIQYPDVNGDGKADVCARSTNGILCATSNGVNGFVSPTTWHSDYSDAAGWAATPAYWATIQYPDVNGDGRADVCGRSSGGIYCAISNGTNGFGPSTVWAAGFSDGPSWSANQANWGTIQYPDVNGDGKADVCGRGSAGVFCAVSTGTSFAGYASWTSSYSDAAGFNADATRWGSIQFPDLDGDGKADVCGRSATGLVCGLSNGSAFSTGTWSAQFGDGDGWSDPSTGGTLQMPNLDLAACRPVAKKSVYTIPVHRLPPF